MLGGGEGAWRLWGRETALRDTAAMDARRDTFVQIHGTCATESEPEGRRRTWGDDGWPRSSAARRWRGVWTARGRGGRGRPAQEFGAREGDRGAGSWNRGRQPPPHDRRAGGRVAGERQPEGRVVGREALQGTPSSHLTQ